MSKSPRILSGLAALVLLAAGPVAHAANLGFLNDTPASWMKQADYDSLAHAVRDAIANTPDGQTANWNNDGLRNAVKIDATITPNKAETDGDKTCRAAAVVVNAKGQSMTLQPQFCRVGNGAWVYQKKH
jgi:surface antigen